MLTTKATDITLSVTKGFLPMQGTRGGNFSQLASSDLTH